ncbi:MAG: DUF1634 domain-containing protein [Gemmatimonadota bacterium]
MSDRTGPTITEEQRVYANLLSAGMYAGLALLLVTFVLYVTGTLEPAVPIERLPEYWGLSVGDYLEQVNHEYLGRDHHLNGWWWITALGFGDFASFLGIAVLSGVTIVCYLAITGILIRKGDWLYATMAIVEALVLILAASGILAVGH